MGLLALSSKLEILVATPEGLAEQLGDWLGPKSPKGSPGDLVEGPGGPRGLTGALAGLVGPLEAEIFRGLIEAPRGLAGVPGPWED